MNQEQTQNPPGGGLTHSKVDAITAIVIFLIGVVMPVPDLVRFVEDRDIWVWQYPESAGFLAALDMEAFDFARWAEIAAFSPAQVTDFMWCACPTDR